MLAPTRHSSEFAVACAVLQLADKGRCSHSVYSPAHVIGQGLSQPVCFAATRWLSAVIEGVKVPVGTSILSEGELPGGTAQNNNCSPVVIHGHSVKFRLSGNHKGAGGRRSSQQQQGSVITKKGPDAWTVSAQVWEHQRTRKLLSSINMFHRCDLGCLQCSTPDAGSCSLALKVLQDIYTHEGVQSQHYNHFRVVECSNLDDFQQWCKEAVPAATASGTHDTASHQVVHIDSAHTHGKQALGSLQQHSTLTASKEKRSRLDSNASQSSGCPSTSISQLVQKFKGLDFKVSQHDRHITRLDSQVILLGDPCTQCWCQHALHSMYYFVNDRHHGNTDIDDMSAVHSEPCLCM